MELWSHEKNFNHTKVQTDAPKVKLEVYFEALCPGCQDFTTGFFSSSSIIIITIVIIINNYFFFRSS